MLADESLFELGKALAIVGAILLALGAMLVLTAKIPWIGRMPGDISYTKGSFTFYFPLVTCILISLLASFVLWLFKR